MLKEELSKYPILKKRADKLRNDIDELQCRDIDAVAGKVKGSMKSFPYTERRFSVQMERPEVAERNRKRIVEKKQEVQKLEKQMNDIEKFIGEIEDIHIKNVFEYRFLEGMTCEEVGKELGYTHGRISQIISKYLVVKNTTQNHLLLKKGMT